MRNVCVSLPGYCTQLSGTGAAPHVRKDPGPTPDPTYEECPENEQKTQLYYFLSLATSSPSSSSAETDIVLDESGSDAPEVKVKPPDDDSPAAIKLYEEISQMEPGPLLHKVGSFIKVHLH